MRKAILALSLALWAPCASAQMMMTGVGTAAITAYGVSYTGPGDIVSGAKFWMGLRAYNAASMGNNAIRVQRASDSTQQDIKSLVSTGALDIASANTFAGTDATCTGSIASTTLTVTSCSGTPHVNDTLTGAGITQPSYITAIGTCAGGNGTCTLNAAQAVSSESIALQTSLVAVTLYDQSGASNCTGACNATVTAGAAPLVLPNCGNALPCLFFSSAAASPSTPSGAWGNQPFTTSAVAERTTGTGLFGFVQGFVNTTGLAVGWFNSATTIGIFATAAPSTTASENALHALQFVVNTSTSDINVDGTAHAVDAGAAINPGTNQLYVRQNMSGNQLTGYLNELGFWSAAFTGPQKTNVCHNQFAYWATVTSC